MPAAAPAVEERGPLSIPQRKVWECPARFRVLVAGRRFGKTYLDLHELIRAARVQPRNAWQRRRVWFIAPTYRQAKQLIWSELLEIIPPHLVAKKDEGDLSLRLAVYGSEIALRGADNPNSLRGPGLDFAVFDEYADMDPTTWTDVIRPALSDRMGEALFSGTPRGFDHFHKLYADGLSGELPNWASFQFTTLEGGNVPLDEIEAARRDLDPRVFRQEYEASFETLEGRVYSQFDRQHNVRADLADTGDLRVGMDFNVNPMTAVLASRVADELHVHHELSLPNADTEAMSDAIDAHVAAWMAAQPPRPDKKPHPRRRVLVYPDPSGNARKSSAPVGQTDFSILRGRRYEVIAARAAAPVVDRINEVNALLCNAKGKRRLFVHPRCKNLIHALEGLTYRPGTSVPNKSLGLDHITDALGYLVHEEFPIGQRAHVGSTIGLIGI